MRIIASRWKRGKNWPVHLGVMFPTQLLELELILLSQLARECMLIIPFPTDDKNEMLVDVLSPVAGI